MSSLKQRVSSYEEIADYKLLSKLPVIISINGRSFSKITSLLDKPYSFEFSECLYDTMLKIIQDVDGAVFGYAYNDEIVIIARNDQKEDTNPWYDNKIQKITSVASSLATFYFSNKANSMDLNLYGDPIFVSKVFTVPNFTETINTLIYKQNQSYSKSLYNACLYELLKLNKYSVSDIKEMLSNTSQDDKIDLLLQECNVDFNDYPSDFRRGVGCYRIPVIMGTEMRNKWSLNKELPFFTKDLNFLNYIIKNGFDIVRKDNV